MPITVIPEVLEKAVSAVVHSLDKATDGELNMVISTANLGNTFTLVWKLFADLLRVKNVAKIILDADTY